MSEARSPSGESVRVAREIVLDERLETGDALMRAFAKALDRVCAAATQRERERAAGVSKRVGRELDAVVMAITTSKRTGDWADGLAAFADEIAAAILAETRQGEQG